MRKQVNASCWPQAVHSCRPAVDVFFRSVAQVYRKRSLAVILTGMGKDGCRELTEKGTFVIAQDEASSVVWGMPRSVAEAGLADKVVSLGQVHRESRCTQNVKNASL